MSIKPQLRFLAASSIFLLATTATANTEMAKDEWLAKLKSVAPATICKSFTENEEVNKQMVAAKIDYNKCVGLVPSIFDKCQTKSYSEIPAMLDKASAEKWGGTIGECIGSDFAANYFISHTNKPAEETKSAPTEKDKGTDSKKPDTAPAEKSKETPNTSNTEANSGSSLTKTEWLDKLKTAAPELICKEFLKDGTLSKQLEKLKISYDKCLSLIPASIEKCKTELFAKIPENINKEAGETWGTTIGECIGKDFAIKYLLPATAKPMS